MDIEALLQSISNRAEDGLWALERDRPRQMRDVISDLEYEVNLLKQAWQKESD